MTNKELFTYSALPQAPIPPPGYVLADLIDHRRMSDNDVAVLCAQLGISARDLCRLLVGGLPIDAHLACQLSIYFGAPSANFWLEMEAAYQKAVGGMCAPQMVVERGVV